MVTTQTFPALQVLFQTRAAVKLVADRQEKKTIFFLRSKNLLKQLCSGPKSWGSQCSPVGSAHSSSFLTRRDSNEMFAEPLSTNFFFFLLASTALRGNTWAWVARSSSIRTLMANVDSSVCSRTLGSPGCSMEKTAGLLGPVGTPQSSTSVRSCTWALTSIMMMGLRAALSRRAGRYWWMKNWTWAGSMC